MESGKSTVFAEINDIIEELTTTGSQNDLDQEYMTKLKRHCKSSNENLKVSYDILMSQLAKKHSEIRYSTFQIIHELFLRSHAFRTMVIFDLQTVFLLAFETEPVSHPLPPPTKVAKGLIRLALRRFYDWYKVYGKHYRKLELGYEYLRDVRKVKFTDAEHVSREEQLKQKQLAEKNEKLRQSKLDQVDMQYTDMHADIESNIKQIENCFQLLLPKVEQFSEDVTLPKEKESYLEGSSDLARNSETLKNPLPTSSTDVSHDVGVETGINKNYAVSIELPTEHVIEVCDDNRAIVSQMKDLYKELKGQLDHVKRWLLVIIKCDSKNKEKMQKLLDLKNTIVSNMEKYRELNINQPAGTDSEDEFIDVPEYDVSATVHRLPANRVQHEATSLEQDRPSTASSSTSTSTSTSSSTSRKEKLLQIAPVVPYDSDLKYWGDEKAAAAAAPSTFSFNSIEQFWWNTDYKEYSETPKNGDAMMKVRKIEFIGKQAPINRKCGASLGNGKFCERMDRVRCPFHGKIVDRDKFGTPIDSVEREKERKRKHEKEREERESIQKEIDAALGTNLSNKKHKKESKAKVRYARLTNIKTEKVKKGMTRLEKKIFSKRAMDKVSKSLDAVSSMIHDGKFGSQFNYRNDSFIGQ